MRTSSVDLIIPRSRCAAHVLDSTSRTRRAPSLWVKFGYVVLSIAALSCARVPADTVTLTPIADTSLFEEVPNNNLGGLTHIPAGTTVLSKHSRALFKFDLTQIPANATITSAVARVQVVKVPSGGGTP